MSLSWIPGAYHTRLGLRSSPSLICPIGRCCLDLTHSHHDTACADDNNEDVMQRTIDYDYKISQNEFKLLRFPMLQSTQCFFAGPWGCIALVHCFHVFPCGSSTGTVPSVRLFIYISLCIVRLSARFFFSLLRIRHTNDNEFIRIVIEGIWIGMVWMDMGELFCT
jgi:hypothetical protein